MTVYIVGKSAWEYTKMLASVLEFDRTPLPLSEKRTMRKRREGKEGEEILRGDRLLRDF